ncbi:MAG: hypothetical protein M1821_008904 [Bathelium mastoideum]|nr:MAG: hypothetical protein M1821_008904 [Bathelium mastoideum]
MATNGTLQTVNHAGDLAASMADAQRISADEIALYDRQIRLWGVQAQEKIRSANILLVSIRALANEIAKNLVLAGIRSITLVDHEVVTQDDLGSQFLVSEADVGQNRAEAAAIQIRKLNPRVAVHTITDDIMLQGPEFYQAFNLVIATCQNYQVLSTINAATRLASRPFYATGMHGFYGYVFADLIQHDYVIEREKGNRDTVLGAESATRSVLSAATKTENGKIIEMVTKRELYSPLLLANTSPLPLDIVASPRKLRQVTPLLTCFRALWDFQNAAQRLPTHSHADLQLFTTLATEKHKELTLPTETLRSEFLRSFLQNLGSELVPVSAFLGGQVVQDVINVLGQREQPLQNFSLFDGEESKGPIYALHPIFSTDLDPAVISIPQMESSMVIPLVDPSTISNAQLDPSAVSTTQIDPSAFLTAQIDPPPVTERPANPSAILNAQVDPAPIPNSQADPAAIPNPGADPSAVPSAPMDSTAA